MKALSIASRYHTPYLLPFNPYKDDFLQWDRNNLVTEPLEIEKKRFTQSQKCHPSTHEVRYVAGAEDL